MITAPPRATLHHGLPEFPRRNSRLPAVSAIPRNFRPISSVEFSLAAVTRPTLEMDAQHLRVLIANERRDRLELLASVVIGLGHDVIAREIYVKEVGPVTAREHPDVALVGLGSSSDHALELISEIVREASCPVIAILHADDPAYVHEAAKRGVFAYIIDGTPEELQSAIDITLQRFTEYQSLQGAFGRRALIEQAKGILMARHSINADTAFERLREHSQHNGRKLSDVAAAVVESHLLLLPELPAAAAVSVSRAQTSS
jgi:AmiR/NasT family two-component response regulator